MYIIFQTIKRVMSNYFDIHVRPVSSKNSFNAMVFIIMSYILLKEQKHFSRERIIQIWTKPPSHILLPTTQSQVQGSTRYKHRHLRCSGWQ